MSAGYLARTAVQGRMSALYNSTYSGLLPSYPGAPTVTFDFSTTSPNVFQGEYDVYDLLKTSAQTWPVLTVYARAGKSVPKQKGMLFSGPVIVCIDIFLALNQSRAAPDFETPCNIHEKTIEVLFNTYNQQAFWGNQLSYNGDLGWVVGPIVVAGPGFVRKMHFELPIEVDMVS